MDFVNSEILVIIKSGRVDGMMVVDNVELRRTVGI